MSLREYVWHPQWWRELLNLIYRLPGKCQWRTAYAHDPDVAEALAAQVDGNVGKADGPERPDWASYTSVDARLDKIGYYLLLLLSRTPSPKGAKQPPAPLGPESLIERRTREAREALDDKAAEALEADLGFTDD